MPDRLQSSLFLVFNYRSFWTSTTQSAIFLTLFQQYPHNAQTVWRWHIMLVHIIPAVRATWHHVTNKAERELSSRCFDEHSPLKRLRRRSTLKWSSNSTDTYLQLAVPYLPKSMENLSSRFSVLKIVKHPWRKTFWKLCLIVFSISYLNALTLMFKMSQIEAVVQKPSWVQSFQKLALIIISLRLIWMRKKTRGRVRSADGLRIRATDCR